MKKWTIRTEHEILHSPDKELNNYERRMKAVLQRDPTMEKKYFTQIFELELN